MGRDKVKERYNQSFTVPATAASYAFERMTFGERPSGMPQDSFQGVTVAVQSGVTDAVYELWLPKVGAVQGSMVDDDYDLWATITSPGETKVLAGYPGAQVRVKSGGTSGTAVLNGSAF